VYPTIPLLFKVRTIKFALIQLNKPEGRERKKKKDTSLRKVEEAEVWNCQQFVLVVEETG